MMAGANEAAIWFIFSCWVELDGVGVCVDAPVGRTAAEEPARGVRGLGGASVVALSAVSGAPGPPTTFAVIAARLARRDMVGWPIKELLMAGEDGLWTRPILYPLSIIAAST
jgi:hypothetical protein